MLPRQQQRSGDSSTNEIESQGRLWLQHWHDLCDPDGPPWEDEFYAAGMINDLWNDRKRLAACLAPLPKADALTTRINEIIDAALGDSAQDPGLYFQISRPYPASDQELIEWTTGFYQRCRELTGVPKVIPSVTIVRCERALSTFLDVYRDTDNSPHTSLADWLGTTVYDRRSLEEQAAYFFLDEALYKMASDYILANYVRWTLVEDEVPGPNPYRAQFDLWRSGARDLFRSGEPAKVFAPQP